jgi:hypothetical protein
MMEQFHCGVWPCAAPITRKTRRLRASSTMMRRSAQDRLLWTHCRTGADAIVIRHKRHRHIYAALYGMPHAWSDEAFSRICLSRLYTRHMARPRTISHRLQSSFAWFYQAVIRTQHYISIVHDKSSITRACSDVNTVFDIVCRWTLIALKHRLIRILLQEVLSRSIDLV